MPSSADRRTEPVELVWRPALDLAAYRRLLVLLFSQPGPASWDAA